MQYVAPVKLHPKGIIMNAVDARYAMAHCKEELEASGAAVMSGLRLNSRFNSTGYNENVRMQSDYGSAVYRVERIAAEELPSPEEDA